MRANALDRVIHLGRTVGHILIATADAAGEPHVAAAGEIDGEGLDGLVVGAWFCPGTLANLQHNPRVALLVWDPQTDEGHQALGEVVHIDDVAILDGFTDQEAAHPMPQIQRRLHVRVREVLEFTMAPHTDRVEGVLHTGR